VKRAFRARQVDDVVHDTVVNVVQEGVVKATDIVHDERAQVHLSVHIACDHPEELVRVIDRLRVDGDVEPVTVVP
jgi:hypothetical protein